MEEKTGKERKENRYTLRAEPPLEGEALKAWKTLRHADHEATLLMQSSALLAWDQETKMPSAGVETRAEQLSLVETLLHQRLVDPRVDESLGVLEAESSASSLWNEGEAAFLREMRRKSRRASRIPESLVSRQAAAAGRAQAAWAKARQADDFSLFEKHLAGMFSLARETAEALGYEDHPYDALLDEYEPGMRSRTLTPLFSRLEKDLAALRSRLDAAEAPPADFLRLEYDEAKQENFSRRILSDMGYEWDRGRLDVSEHPFTTTLGGDDIRITTRYQKNWPSMGLFGSIHEGGHALYEMGIDPGLHGTLLAEGTSLGIHESQSRFWENMVGRSHAFWEAYYGSFQALFFPNLRDVSLEDFYRGINRVDPHQVRIEADEVTYSLHIVLRYQLEMALLSGDLPVKDLPAAWREKQKKLLGVEPPSDAQGVLQDVHWSAGLVGYFPTYALGNLYAAQFRDALTGEMPRWEDDVRQARLKPLKEWLAEKIHSHGRVYSAEELCRRLTGETLKAQPFMDYLQEKYSRVYSLD